MNRSLHVAIIVSLYLALSNFTPGFAQNTAGKIEYKAGLAAYKAGNYKTAATYFWKSITAGNATVHAWLYMAHSYSAAGNKNKAIETYRKVASIFKGTEAEKMALSAIKKLDPHNTWKVKRSGAGKKISSYSSISSTNANLPKRARVFYKSKGDDIILNVRINGRPIDMELDTGAPGIVLDKSRLSKLGIRLPQGKPAGYSGGATNSNKIPYWKIKATVQVGPIRRENMQVKVYEKMHTDPLLGQRFFKDFDYTIDHKARCVEFRRKGLTTGSTGRGYSVPFEFRKSGNRIVIEIELNGKKGKAMLDTGNTADGISFDSKKQMAKFGVQLPRNANIGSSIGVSGSGSQYEFTLRRVRLGPIDKRNVSASCALEIEPGDEELPLVGQEVLKGWQYSIDMNKKVIHFLRR